MPFIEGIEIPRYERVERRSSRQEQWLRYYNEVRKKAIASLGGKCNCGEEDQDKLQIVALTEEAKQWSQALFYKRVVDACMYGGAPTKLGKLICKKCRFQQMTLAAIERRRANKAQKGTGEFYWIGGMRVEQVRAKTGITEVGTLTVHPRYEDSFEEEEAR